MLIEKRFDETLGEYLRRVRETKGFTQRQLAYLSGVSNTTISRIEKNETKIPDLVTLKALAKALNIDEDYLISLVDAENKRDIIAAPVNEYLSNEYLSKFFEIREVGEMVPIPIVGSVRAGVNGTLAYDDFLGKEMIEKEIVKDGATYFFLKVKGDSMYPLIMDGDLALVRQQNDIESGEIGVVILNGNEGIVKKIIKKENSIILQSINPSYEPIVITSDDDFRIVGKVKRIVRIFY